MVDIPEQKTEPKTETISLLPALFAAIETLGGQISVPKQIFDNFPKDFGINIQYVEERKAFIFTNIKPKKRGVLRPDRALILPN